MKFRNPETREVYNLTYKDCVSSGFCKKYGTCFPCPIYEKADDGTCSLWVVSHPYEAARLMGYEVVEDEQFRKEKKKEEANMDKPRICEVMGVEVDEEFTIGENQYFIDKSGDMWCVTKNGEKLKCGTAICCAINHPERIIRKTRFTEQDVEDAKYIRRILKVDSVRRNIYGNGLIAMKSDNTVSVVINSEMFPSIHSGELYTLDEIIKSEVKAYA